MMLSLALSPCNPLLSGSGWTPAALFGASDVGDWGDAADLTAGAVAQWDGRRGVVSLRQAVAGSQPVAATAGGLSYVTFDGTDDGLASAAALDLSGTDKVTVVLGLRKTSDAATAAVLEHSASSSATNGTFAAWAPLTAAANYTFRSRGTTSQDASATAAGYAAPHTAVVTGQGDIAGDRAYLRVNGSLQATDVDDQGTGNFTSQTLYMGRRGGSSLPFAGRVYAWIVVGRLLSADEIARAEAWMAVKCGVTL